MGLSESDRPSPPIVGRLPPGWRREIAFSPLNRPFFPLQLALSPDQLDLEYKSSLAQPEEPLCAGKRSGHSVLPICDDWD